MPGKKTKKPVFDQVAMAKAMSAETGRKIEPLKQPFQEILFSDDLRKIMFTVEGMK